MPRRILDPWRPTRFTPNEDLACANHPKRAEAPCEVEAVPGDVSRAALESDSPGHIAK